MGCQRDHGLSEPDVVEETLLIEKSVTQTFANKSVFADVLSLLELWDNVVLKVIFPGPCHKHPPQ